MKTFVKEFKDFITRGNVIDLAVAVVIGAAFVAVVNSFAKDVLLQIVAAIFGKPNFDGLSFSLNGTEIYYGLFLTALVTFLIIAFVVFLVVKAINTLQNLRRKEEEASPAELTEIELLTQIRDSLQAQQGGPGTL